MAATVSSPRAGGGAASSDMSTSGSRSVNSCSARADMAMPGRMAPPRNAPSAETQIDRDGGADVDDDGRAAGPAQGDWPPRRPAADPRPPCPAAAASPPAAGRRRPAASRGLAAARSRSQSISRVAAGRFTLPMYQEAARGKARRAASPLRPNAPAIQAARREKSGPRPSSWSVASGSGNRGVAAARRNHPT